MKEKIVLIAGRYSTMGQRLKMIIEGKIDEQVKVLNDISKQESYTLTNPYEKLPELSLIGGYKRGKEQRRERRKKERQLNKNNK